MMDSENLEEKFSKLYQLFSQPVDKVQDIQQQRKLRKEMKKFYNEQFREMVENGNYEKAVELVHDEAENLNFRLGKEVTPETLAEFCREQCEQTLEKMDMEEKSGFFKDTVERLTEKYPEKRTEE